MRLASIARLAGVASSFLLQGASGANINRYAWSRRDLDNSTLYQDYLTPLTYPSPNATGSGKWAVAAAKARAFVEDLTLDELVNLTTGTGFGGGRCVGNTGTIARKGFAGICLEDGPLGIRPTDFASVFPAGINAASTWDKDLLWKRGKALGAEFRGKGANVALGPMNNLGRVAAGGRNWEGFGADPYLSGVAAAETIKGIQSQGVIACAKHYIGNEQETYRGPFGETSESSNIDDRTTHEVYAWPFAAGVAAGVGSVMCSYNRVNQTHSCENSKTLNGILKGELDFQGFVVSDWGGVNSGAPSALAGLDMSMPGQSTTTSTTNSSFRFTEYWGTNLIAAVNNGSVPISRVRDMVTRTMTSYYQMGQDKDFPAVNFDSNTEDTYSDGVLVNEHVDVQADHYILIREIAAASTVLLKNINATLPLSATSHRRWGIFGSDAGPPLNGPNGISTGEDDGTLAVGWGSGAAQFPYLIDPLSAIQTFLRSKNPHVSIEAVLNDTNYNQVTSVARKADACLAFVNAPAGEGTDRANLTLWHDGDALVKNVTSQCANTVVVIHSAGVVLIESWVDNPNVTAILYAGLPGQESGNAIVDVIFGAVNPSGRLAQTIAKNRSDYGADVLYNSSLAIPEITYTDKLLIDYRWFDAKNITPRFEFGFGLSYTTFEYSGISIDAVSSESRRGFADLEPRTSTVQLFDDVYQISFEVTNTGSLDGHEVSQLYLAFPATAGEPPKVLRDFERTFIKKGESATLTLSLTRKDISIWDVVKQAWVIPTGTFTVLVGQSSRLIKLSATFSL